MLTFTSTTNLVRQVKTGYEISNELHEYVLRYRKLTFRQVDPFYRKTLISSTKKYVQIAFAQLK